MEDKLTGPYLFDATSATSQPAGKYCGHTFTPLGYIYLTSIVTSLRIKIFHRNIKAKDRLKPK